MPGKTPFKINRLKRARQTVLFQTMAEQDTRKIRYKEARLQLPVVGRAKRFNERARNWSGPLTPRMKRAIALEFVKRSTKATYLKIKRRAKTAAIKLHLQKPRWPKRRQKQEKLKVQT